MTIARRASVLVEVKPIIMRRRIAPLCAVVCKLCKNSRPKNVLLLEVVFDLERTATCWILACKDPKCFLQAPPQMLD